jgi:hypothetical protein
MVKVPGGRSDLTGEDGWRWLDSTGRPASLLWCLEVAGKRRTGVSVYSMKMMRVG